MHPKEAPVISTETTMKEYRKEYREKQNEFLRPENRPRLRGQLIEILDVVVKPRSVDMKEFKGSDEKLRRAVEYFYPNDGRAFDPTTHYPPGMIDNYGKEYALNARGIYYFNDFRPDLVTVDRKVWIPSFDDTNWEDSSECDRRERARVIVQHNLDNETRHKSEYAWEADAWADVFNKIRNDPCLEVDKHDYFTELPKTHPVLCTLTNESTMVNRIPDATFGLATFSDSTRNSPVKVKELKRERLEKLLLHPKCGLLSDPKWGETDLAFPFAVYEAKGWSGDCREARRQACQGGACYLDMLDNLARKPGPVGSTKLYQTPTSHRYQVFALTSFGAHWHLLVGYQRPRQAEEYAGIEGMSKTVYIFQRVWSARVTNERAAWELLSLIDQIHLWAITEFRTFVTEHLKPWHKFCNVNYLLDWKSVYDVKPELKQMRNCGEDTDLSLPSWVKLLNQSAQEKVQARARNSLAEALKKHRRRKGKGKCDLKSGWHCVLHPCSTGREKFSSETILDHLREMHQYSDEDLNDIKRCIDEAKETNRKEVQGEELDNGGSDGCAENNNSNQKRCFVEEGSLNDGPRDSSSECIPGPSKRARMV